LKEEKGCQHVFSQVGERGRKVLIKEGEVTHQKKHLDKRKKEKGDGHLW